VIIARQGVLKVQGASSTPARTRLGGQAQPRSTTAEGCLPVCLSPSAGVNQSTLQPPLKCSATLLLQSTNGHDTSSYVYCVVDVSSSAYGSMEPSLIEHAPAFRKALHEFRSDLPQDDRDEFKCTTLEDLQRSILDIQAKHVSGRKSKNMTRLKPFLEAMEQYGKVIEVFLNTSEFIAFVWVYADVSVMTESQLTSSYVGPNEISLAGVRYPSESQLPSLLIYVRLRPPSLKHSTSF
jgi:hypothetical protein